jgi:hypothetical protein
MLRRLGAAFLTAALFLATPSLAAATNAAQVAVGSLRLFATEDAAQRHCPRDEVVWLNTNSGVYHAKGMRWYGRTKHGVCLSPRS